MVSRNFLKNLVVKNLIVSPSPTKSAMGLVSIKQMRLAAKRLCLAFWYWQLVSVEGMKEVEKAMMCYLVIHQLPTGFKENTCQVLALEVKVSCERWKVLPKAEALSMQLESLSLQPEPRN
jgi:hypothetical protein